MENKELLKYILPILLVTLGMSLTRFGVNELIAYSIKASLGLIAIIYFWKQYKEIKIKFDLLAWAFGLLIIIIWIGLKFLNKGNPSSYDPSNLSYLLIPLKLVGMVIIAPVIEEIFIRSFLIRMFINPNIEKVKIGTFSFLSFIVTVLIFGFLHGSSLTGSRLVVGLIAGAMFNLWLYYRKDIFSCIQCHAAANLFLAVYVILTQNWRMW